MAGRSSVRPDVMERWLSGRWRGTGLVIWLILLTGLTAWSGWMGLTDRSHSLASALRCQQILAPAYYWIDDNYAPMWQRLTNDGTSGQIIVAGLPADDTAPDPLFVSVIRAAQAKGIRVLGYVQTQYGAGAEAVIEVQIRNYQDWYHLDGIFIDEVIPDAEHFAYYQTLTNAVHARPGQLVVLNPGGIPDRAYLGIADIIVVFEGSYRHYQTYYVPSWLYAYPADRFANLVHSTGSTAEMEHALALSRSRNAGYVYVTDDTGANAYHLLPNYWPAETTAITRTCDGATSAAVLSEFGAEARAHAVAIALGQAWIP